MAHPRGARKTSTTASRPKSLHSRWAPAIRTGTPSRNTFAGSTLRGAVSSVRRSPRDATTTCPVYERSCSARPVASPTPRTVIGQPRATRGAARGAKRRAPAAFSWNSSRTETRRELNQPGRAGMTARSWIFGLPRPVACAARVPRARRERPQRTLTLPKLCQIWGPNWHPAAPPVHDPTPCKHWRNRQMRRCARSPRGGLLIRWLTVQVCLGPLISLRTPFEAAQR